ncbi:MAG: 2'-5' RNA ligase family protein [Chloroflexota bacterium]
MPPRLAAIRRREVEVARLGVPPHVTILSPFVEVEEIDGAVVARVAEVVAGVPAFDVSFGAVRRWPASELGPGVVWLEPTPAEPFVALTRASWAAFPGYPPYGREDDDLETHLTIAIDEPARFDAVEAEASRLVPFRRRATSVALLVEGPQGRWRTRRRFPLAVG